MKVNLTKLLLTTFIISNSMAISGLSAMQDDEAPSSTGVVAHQHAPTLGDLERNVLSRLQILDAAKIKRDKAVTDYHAGNAKHLATLGRYEGLRCQMSNMQLSSTRLGTVPGWGDANENARTSLCVMRSYLRNVPPNDDKLPESSFINNLVHFFNLCPQEGCPKEEELRGTLTKIYEHAKTCRDVFIKEIDLLIIAAKRNLFEIQSRIANHPGFLDRLRQDAQPIQN